jgi:hypothetical protein
MFTPACAGFVRAVLSHLASTFGTPLGLKFFQMSSTPTTIDFTARCTIAMTFPLFLNHTLNDALLAFCFRGLNYAESRLSVRIVMAKIVQYAIPKITEPIIDCLRKTRDPVILLEYVDALAFFGSYRTSRERTAMNDLRSELAQRLRLVTSPKHPSAFLVESLAFDRAAFPPDMHYLSSILEPLRRGDPSAIARGLLQKHPSDPAVFRVLTMSDLIAMPGFSEMLVAELRSFLQDRSALSVVDIRPADYMVTIAQSYVARLLLLGLSDLAGQLLKDVLSLVAKDNAPLHWMTLFLSKYRSLIPRDSLEQIGQLVGRLPKAEELFVTEGDIVMRIANLLAARVRPLIQDPGVIGDEYTSPFDHALAFSHCSLAVLALDGPEIGEMLSRPLFEYRSAWRGRQLACCCLAKLAAAMCCDVGFHFFKCIMANRASEVGLEAGRLFLMDCHLDVFNEVCVNTKAMLAESHIRLEYFMRMAIPSYQRLEGDPTTAARMLCGLLETVSGTTPRLLQESVIDLVGFLYARLKLGNVRHLLISAATRVDADLRAVLPLCLELDASD